MKGKFITFEGPDGSGKTTCTQGVYEKLLAEGYDVIYTREPGGIEIAEQIRNIILDPKNTMMDARCEALLYAASRRQHLVEKVLPALEQGKIVLCDRFVDSSLAYQGAGRHLGIDEVWSINQFAIEGHMPDYTIYLKVDPQVGLKRIASRNNKDRLDQESLQFHLDTYQGYQEVVARFEKRMIVIDANQSAQKVIAQAYQIVKDSLNV
ncbi:MAG: dTMP kinase [Erysipelotrichaceae bacterium]|nr:dTMP kinase [Erysipelotrichaceae bacterium]MDY5251824.1 dTMP kinase [Erysipelotrichaceae bacterium]